MNKAIKSDWKTLDMPEKTASFSIDIGLTEGEFFRTSKWSYSM